MSTDSVFFYSIAQPDAGVIGSATLEDGKFGAETGVASLMIESVRKRFYLEDGDSTAITDQKVFDTLSDNWVSGVFFTLPKEFTGAQIKEYVG
jgi:hypothetical protein